MIKATKPILLLLLILILAACGKSSNAQLKECLDLGQKYMTEMNYEEAIIAYNKALEIDPKNVDAYQALANIYEFRGDIDQAKSTMERALIAVPSNAELQSRYERLMQIPSSNRGTGTGKTNPGSSLNGQSEGIPANQAGPAGSPTTAAPTEASIKANGWVQMNGKWYFYAGGEKATGWMRQGETWFYFDEEGVLQHGKTKIGNDWYYFNEDGAMVIGWQEENGKWYYFGPDGRMLTDQWIEDTYYVGPDGAMLVSTTTPDGQEVDAEGRKIIKLPVAEYLTYLKDPNLYLDNNVNWGDNGTYSVIDENGSYVWFILFSNPPRENGFILSANKEDIIDRGSYYEVRNQELLAVKEYDNADSIPQGDIDWVGVLPNGKYSHVAGGVDVVIADTFPIWKGSYYLRKDAVVKFRDDYYLFDPNHFTYTEMCRRLKIEPAEKRSWEKDHMYIVREIDEKGYITLIEEYVMWG